MAVGRGDIKEEKEEKEKKKEEKIPHMCESIGHRPLRGRCPKTMNIWPRERVSTLYIEIRTLEIESDQRSR